MSSSPTFTAIATHCSGYVVSNLWSVCHINKYGCSTFDNGFHMTSNNLVLTFLQGRALKGGSNGNIAMLCGGIITTVGVFILIPRQSVTNATFMSVTWEVSESGVGLLCQADINFLPQCLK